MSDERLQELLAADALGRLDESERAELDRALTDNPSAVDELNDLYETAALLAYGVEPAEPRPEIRDAVLSRARAARVYESPSADSSWRNRVSLLFGGVAAAGVVAALAIAVLLGGRIAELESRAELGTERTSQEVAVLQTLVDDQQSAIRLSGTDNAPKASAFLLMTPDENVAVLVCSGLTRLASDRGYQLWLNNADKNVKLSGGVVNADYYGFALLVVNSPMPISEFKSFGVTVEPLEGSPKPTGDPVLRSGSQ